MDWNIICATCISVNGTSPSSRGRGLKFFHPQQKLPIWWVALFTRAWIEIKLYPVYITGYISRPLHEGVDWNSLWYIHNNIPLRRPLHEGVDWNHNFWRVFNKNWIVALFTRAWIEICYNCFCFIVDSSRPLHEGVDWNCCVRDYKSSLWWSPSSRGRGLKLRLQGFLNQITLVALFTRAWIEIQNYHKTNTLACVALFTRAWIEIPQAWKKFEAPPSRPLHEGVDWNTKQTHNEHIDMLSPSSRGRGLKSRPRVLYAQYMFVALFTRAWIEI